MTNGPIMSGHVMPATNRTKATNNDNILYLDIKTVYAANLGL